jgi:hypothetical protein
MSIDDEITQAREELEKAELDYFLYTGVNYWQNLDTARENLKALEEQYIEESE